MSPIEKTAIVLLVLGKDVAAEILSKIDKHDVKKIASTMSRLGRVDQKTVESVMLEFAEHMENTDEGVFYGQPDLTKAIMERAFGAEKSDEMLDGLGFEVESLRVLLDEIDSQILADFCKDEKDQTIAAILSLAPLVKRVAVFKRLPQERFSKIMMNIASMQTLNPEVLQELEDTLRELKDKSAMIKRMSVGGPEIAAQILNQMDGSTADGLLKEIAVINPSLADQIQAAMFRFPDLVRIDRPGMQKLIAETDRIDWQLALRKCSAEISQYFFENVSSRVAEDIKDQMNSSAPAPMAEVEEAQRRLVSKARELEKANLIQIRHLDEEYV